MTSTASSRESFTCRWSRARPCSSSASPRCPKWTAGMSASSASLRAAGASSRRRSATSRGRRSRQSPKSRNRTRPRRPNGAPSSRGTSHEIGGSCGMTLTAVVDPESVGVDTERLDELRTRARREVDGGLLPSCQFALARDGRLAAYDTVGDAGLDTRFVIFSATKAFVASAAWLLIGEGSLDIDRRVAEYIPEFATNGKDVVTVEQVMLHTSGFPRAPLGPPAWADRDRRLEAFAKWRLNWEPGTAHEYHPTSAHWVLAELTERISGRDYRDFIHERVTGALGLSRV